MSCSFPAEAARTTPPHSVDLRALPGSPPAARLHTCSRARVSELRGPQGLPAVPAHTQTDLYPRPLNQLGVTRETPAPAPMRVRAHVECVRTWVACGVHQVPWHSGWGRIPGRTNLVLRFPPRSHSLLGVPVVFTLQRCPSPLSLHLWWATL